MADVISVQHNKTVKLDVVPTNSNDAIITLQINAGNSRVIDLDTIAPPGPPGPTGPVGPAGPSITVGTINSLPKSNNGVQVVGGVLYEQLADGIKPGLLSAADYNLFAAGGGGSGTVTGPVSSTDTAVARFNGTTGQIIQNSGVLIDANDIIKAYGMISKTNLPSTASITIASDEQMLVASGYLVSGTINLQGTLLAI